MTNKERLLELLQGTGDVRLPPKDAQDIYEWLQAAEQTIRRLEKKGCCRSQKKAFMAGFSAGHFDGIEGGGFTGLHPHYEEKVIISAYKTWKKSCGNTS